MQAVIQEETFRQYRLQRIYGHTTAALSDEIIAFWRHYQALPPSDDGRERSRQVFFIARNPAGELVGVCSVYIDNFARAGDPHYFYRTFIRPEDRNYFLMIRMWQRTSECLLAEYTPGTPRGLVVIAENPLFQHPKLHQQLRRVGYRHLGKEERGCDVWYLDLTAAS
jgi:hypothetical protein